MSSQMRSVLRSMSWLRGTGADHPRTYHTDSRVTTFADLAPHVRGDFQHAIRRYSGGGIGTGRDGTWTPIWALIKPRSVLLAVECQRPPRRLFMKRKRCRSGNQKEEAIRATARDVEFAAHIRNEVPEIEGCRVMPILAAYPDLIIQIYDFIPAISLEDIILHRADSWIESREGPETHGARGPVAGVLSGSVQAGRHPT